MSDERQVTHYVSDDCPGGHRDDDTPIDLEAALRAARDRIVYACIMPDGGGVTGRNAALDQYEALARAVGAWDNHCDPKSEETVYGRAERVAREVLMHSERKAD